MLVARILRGALKLRYLVLGGTIGGGAALSNVSPRNLHPETNHDIIPRAYHLVAEIRAMEGRSAGHEVAGGGVAR